MGCGFRRLISMSKQADVGGGREGSTITVAFLQQVPLFAELTADELHDLVAVMQPIELAPGQLLWRQGQAADALHLIRGGRIGIYLRQPGGTEVHLTTVGPGEVIGELPLIAGGTRSATARALDQARLWSLSRVDFAALTLRRTPTALALRRRICAVACTRLRDRYQQLANSLPPGLPPGASEPPTAAQLMKSAPPDDYLSNLAFFRDFAADQLRSLVERSKLFMIPRRRVLEHEGDAPRGCYVSTATCTCRNSAPPSKPISAMSVPQARMRTRKRHDDHGGRHRSSTGLGTTSPWRRPGCRRRPAWQSTPSTRRG